MTYLITTVLLFNLIAFFIPKKLSKIESLTTSMFAVLFAENVDFVLDLYLGLYGYFQKGVDLMALIPIFGLYPAVNMIFLNYYPFSAGWIGKGLYLLGWDLFLVAYEWGAIQSGFFYHNGWNYGYSAVANPFVLLGLLGSLKVVRRIV